MYRALALKALQRGVPLDAETQLAKLANENPYRASLANLPSRKKPA